MIKDIEQLKKTELGFTLIEVMVVIIMVGILAAIAVPIYTNYVYRARTSEAVTTLGAIKTYLMERRNATGSWPDNDDMKGEFKNFSELYYFDKEKITLDNGGTQNDTITVSIVAKNDTFDPPDKNTTYSLTLLIDWSNAENGGWGGNIRDNWAKHLKTPPSGQSS